MTWDAYQVGFEEAAVSSKFLLAFEIGWKCDSVACWLDTKSSEHMEQGPEHETFEKGNSLLKASFPGSL